MRIYEETFSVKGVTFKNEDNKDIQKLIDKTLRWSKSNGFIDKEDLYEGYTNKEIIEDDLCVGEFVDCVYGGKIELDKFDGKDCIKVYLHTDDDKYIHVGYLPKNKIDEVKNYLSNKELTTNIVLKIKGGKYKKVRDDEIYIDELTYGLDITVIFSNNIPMELASADESDDTNLTEKQEEVGRKFILFIIAIMIVITIFVGIKSN